MSPVPASALATWGLGDIREVGDARTEGVGLAPRRSPQPNAISSRPLLLSQQEGGLGKLRAGPHCP